MPRKLKYYQNAGFSVSLNIYQGNYFLTKSIPEFMISAIELLQQLVAVEVISLKGKCTEAYHNYEIKSTVYELLLYWENKEVIQVNFVEKEFDNTLQNYLMVFNQILFDKKIPFQLVAYEKSKTSIQVFLITQDAYERYKSDCIVFDCFEKLKSEKLIEAASSNKTQGFAQIQFSDDNQKMTQQTLLSLKKLQNDQLKQAKKALNYFAENKSNQYFIQNLLKDNPSSEAILQLLNISIYAEIDAKKQILETIPSDDLNDFLTSFKLHLESSDEWFYRAKAKILFNFVKIILPKAIDNNSSFFTLLPEKAYQKRNLNAKVINSKLAQDFIKLYLTSENAKAISIIFRMRYQNKDKALKRSIERLLSRIDIKFSEEEVLEQTVEDFGLDNQCFEEEIDGYKAKVFIESTQKASTTWQTPEGKTQKSLPTYLKNNHSKEVQKLKDKIKQIKKTLQTQRQTLEKAWIKNRLWSFEDWRIFIFKHKLLSFYSHKLIWTFITKEQKELTGFFDGNVWITANEKTFTLENIDKVKLWHPVEASNEDVLSWRSLLFAKEVLQPFKQAFREIYVLTAAEIATATYSNRFSAHILKGNQLFALAKQREWAYSKRYDYGEYHPTLALTAYNIKVTLLVDHKSVEYQGTQRLVFQSLDGDKEIHLKDVHEVAFSEVMRDVDLFVAVASIGNDPNWTGEEEYGNYWLDYSFGDMSDTASSKTRKEVLEKVVPKLNIADKCSFEKNFLVVEGKLHTYKINIGSANILIQSNDQYLCIVPSVKNKKPDVFLPFEGDSTLKLILSKAFLLVDDDKIKDETIISQIKSE